METLLADVRQALRLMRNSPGFTVVAIAALTLGIGANIGIFSVIDKVLLQPLPFPQPDRIMKLGRQYPNDQEYSNSIPKYMIWRRNDVFSAMALYDQGGPGFNLSTGDHPEQVKGLHISADYFKVLAVNPIRGRTFSAAEDSPNGPKAAIINEKLWRSHFGGEDSMLGRTIILNGEPYPVIGIMPASFDHSEAPAEVWVSLQADPNSVNQAHYLYAAGRLKPGVTLSEARAAMAVLGNQFRRANPKSMDKNESVAVVPMRDAMVGNVKTALWILLAAVVFVLLIACGNVANLLLARAASRQRELAIRSAVGASRWRVVRQLLTESVLLAGLGGLCGLILGVWGVRLLLLMVPGNIPRLPDPKDMGGLLSLLDIRVVAFTVGVSLLTGILFGLFPALHISNPDVASTLKEASGRSGTGRRQNRVRKVLVGTEMALALVLLIAAALLIRSFAGLSAVKPGIDPHGVLTMRTSLVGSAYASTKQVDRFTTQAIQRIEGLPGVSSAAIAVTLPTESHIDLTFDIAGRTPKAGEDSLGDEQYRFVSPHYFATFKIPLANGRFFNERDTSNSARVVIVNRAFAAKYWPRINPVGQVMIIGKHLGPDFADSPRQVIGVVGDVHETALNEKDVPVMYVPQSQVPDPLTRLASASIPLAWAIRTGGNPNTVRALVEREVHAVDGQMSISELHTMDELLAKGVAREHFNTLLLSLFAGIALVLAAIGIYGLMSYSVEQQTQELGIRVALGAEHGHVMSLIIREGMTPALIGVAAGLAIAFGVMRILGTLLYGIGSSDPGTFVAVAVILTVVALCSTYIPARRAMRIDPVIALRNDA